MNSISDLSPKQLRRAAGIQEKNQSLQEDLSQILGGSGETATIEAPMKSRKVSAAGRARMRAAQKARWAKAKAAGKTKL